MKIGEFSRRLGVTPPTVRFYENLGLIAPAGRISGSRRYDERALRDLRIVLALKRVGFTLVEIKGLLANSSSPAASKLWQTSARAKVSELGRQIAELRSAQQILVQSFDCDCDGHVERCSMLALIESVAVRARGRANGRRASLRSPELRTRRA
jgi:DNA-binding transcriptional MerR regulator